MSNMASQGFPSRTTDGRQPLPSGTRSHLPARIELSESDPQADYSRPEGDGTLDLTVHEDGTIKAGRPSDLSVVVTCVQSKKKGITFECHVFAGTNYYNHGGRDKCAETVRSVLNSEKAEIERTTHYTSGRFVHPNSNQVCLNEAIAASDVAGIIRYHYEIAQPDLRCMFHGLGDTLLPGTFYPYSSSRPAGMATSSANQQSQRALRDAKQRGDISGYRSQLAQDDLLLYAMPIPIKWGCRGTSVELVKADPDHHEKNLKYLKGRNRARSVYTKDAVGTSEPRRERKSKYRLESISQETETPDLMTHGSLADDILSKDARRLAAIRQAAGPRDQTISTSTLGKPLPIRHAHAPGASDISSTATFSSANANLASLSGLLPHTVFGSVNGSVRRKSLVNPGRSTTTQYLNPESGSSPGDHPSLTPYPIAPGSAVPVRSFPRFNDTTNSQLGQHTAWLAQNPPLERDWWGELMSDESGKTVVPPNGTEPGQYGNLFAYQHHQSAQIPQSPMYNPGQTLSFYDNPNNPQAPSYTDPWSQNQQSPTSGPHMYEPSALYPQTSTGQHLQSFCPPDYVDPEAPLLETYQGTYLGYNDPNSRPWGSGT